jgi:hypothetical protein
MPLNENELKDKLAVIDQYINQQSDDLVLILRVHLLIEHYIEEIIRLSVKRSDYIIDDGRVTFYHKLCFLQSLDVIPENYIASILKLNKIRNNYSHELNYKISERDIDLIGIPLGEQYNDIKLKPHKIKLVSEDRTKVIKEEVNLRLTLVLTALLGVMDGYINGLAGSKK